MGELRTTYTKKFQLKIEPACGSYHYSTVYHKETIEKTTKSLLDSIGNEKV